MNAMTMMVGTLVESDVPRSTCEPSLSSTLADPPSTGPCPCRSIETVVSSSEVSGVSVAKEGLTVAVGEGVGVFSVGGSGVEITMAVGVTVGTTATGAVLAVGSMKTISFGSAV